jgi:hypothetical protein
MLRAHTVRRLKPGTFEQFAEAFRPDEGAPPPGWVRFDMARGVTDENAVVTFGFFDGTLEELDRNQEEGGYRERVDAVAPFVSRSSPTASTRSWWTGRARALAPERHAAALARGGARLAPACRHAPTAARTGTAAARRRP